MKKLFNVLIYNKKSGDVLNDFNEISHSKDYLKQKYKKYSLGYPKYNVDIKRIQKIQGVQMEINYTQC